MTERFDTVVVGAGQAGLAIGYYLAEQGRDFVILDADSEVGGTWRRRWDSLQLFTPAGLSNLPGLPFPAPSNHYPTKNETAEYLERYAATFQLPLSLDTAVESLTPQGAYYLVKAGRRLIEARNVVIATGAYQAPSVPAFESELDPAIVQIHSSQYRNPDTLRDGEVLVVGAGNSGAQIGIELAASKRTWLSGRDVGRIPQEVLGRPIHWWLYRTRVLTATRESWIGRRLHGHGGKGGVPLIGTSNARLAGAGVERVPRTVGVRDGKPLLEDGRVMDVANVVWCTGFRPDFSWISSLVRGDDGNPRHHRGIVRGEPGLFFLGLIRLHRLDSSLLAGVGFDAGYIAQRIAAQT